MNFNTFKEIRQQIYDTFGRGADALFNLCDALLTEPHARSLPELSLSPFFEREWSSVYQALEHGMIDPTNLRRIWIGALMSQRAAAHPIWISVDSTSIARPEAETKPGSWDHLRPEYASCQQTDQCRLARLDDHAFA